MSDAKTIEISPLPFEQLEITVATASTIEADVTVYAHTSTEFETQIDAKIKAFAAYAGFKGKAGAQSHTFNDGAVVALLGLGALTTADHHEYTKIGIALSTIVTATKAKKVTIQVPVALTTEQIRVIVEKFFFEVYVDSRYRAEKKAVSIEAIEFVVPTSADVETFNTGITIAKAIAKGTFYTRDVVNAPANVCHPDSFSQSIKELAEESGLEITIIDREECEKLGMGSFIAVGKGSLHQPCFVHVAYKPTAGATKKLVFIGKGITFDTGGYNIKTAGMESMKIDMGGAGAVFGAAKTIAALKPEGVEVHFISALAENMINSDSYRPGDILTAGNGKTIEVLNTDAEGRLTMADALVYAEREINPDFIVEFSTLTGAQLVALGAKIAALMCKDETLCEEVKTAAKKAGELLWELPLFEEYRDGYKSKCADIANLDPSRHAGTISAGLFLNEFVDHTPYAHIDIAGPAFDMPKGTATGYGVRIILALVEAYAAKAAAASKKNCCF